MKTHSLVACLFLLACAAACSSKATPSDEAHSRTIAEQSSLKAKPTSKPAHRERRNEIAAPSPDPVVPAVDPARIAVEEDYIGEAAQRITKRSNLDAELQRLATEIGPSVADRAGSSGAALD